MDALLGCQWQGSQANSSWQPCTTMRPGRLAWSCCISQAQNLLSLLEVWREKHSTHQKAPQPIDLKVCHRKESECGGITVQQSKLPCTH